MKQSFTLTNKNGYSHSRRAKTKAEDTEQPCPSVLRVHVTPLQSFRSAARYEEATPMIRFRAVGSCMLALAFWATTGSAQSLSALNGDIAVRSALEMGKTQGWEVLFDGLGGSP